ncbi:MAG: hypothetical protein V3U02_05130 [Calditrichia bacterium]
MDEWTIRKDNLTVWYEYYEEENRTVVFVNGHALCKGSSCSFVAHYLAKANGQDSIGVTTYGAGKPTHRTEKLI